MATSLMNVFFFDVEAHHRGIQRVKKNGAQHEGFFSHGLGCEAKHDRHGVQDNTALRRRFVLPTWCQGNSGRKKCFIDYKMANACVVQPYTRPVRQESPNTATETLMAGNYAKATERGCGLHQRFVSKRYVTLCCTIRPFTVNVMGFFYW